MNIHRFSLGLRFSLAIGVILLIFSALLSVSIYFYMKTQVIKDAEEKIQIIMTHVKAVGSYVRESLRPKMFDLLSHTEAKDGFIVEAMSTTHVNLQVMKRFKKDLPQYVFKRVSDSPLNPDNIADPFHRQMIRYFQDNRTSESWQGRVTMQGEEALVYVRPVISDKSCLKCHGDPKEIEPSFYQKYRERGRFEWKTDAVVGVESVSVPLHLAFAQIRKVAMDTFLFGFSMLLVLFLTIYAIFRHLVSGPLKKISGIFRSIADGSQSLGGKIHADRNDEIGDLTESFNMLSQHLLEAEEKLKQTSEIEKQMMASEKLAALGQLSAGVAHEINNPLGGIKLCFNNMTSTPMDKAAREEHIEVINAGFDRIQNIVGQLLDYSKNSRLALEQGSVCKIIGNVLKLAEYTMTKKGITLDKDLVGDIPEIAMDTNKMEQVFLNILINAIQATDAGGKVTIKTGCDGAICSVSVTNTGKRIPEEALSRIFDPFFTTKDVGEGTGLGLTVSKSIVEQHKGVIEVSTTETETTFTVKLPVA